MIIKVFNAFKRTLFFIYFSLKSIGKRAMQIVINPAIDPIGIRGLSQIPKGIRIIMNIKME